MTPEIIAALLQIPVVAALIYLVLALEDRRMEALKGRDATFVKIFEALVGVIDELSSQNSPDRLTAAQLKAVKEYLNRGNGEPR